MAALERLHLLERPHVNIQTCVRNANSSVLCRGSAGEGEWRECSWKNVLAGDSPHSEQVRPPTSQHFEPLAC